MSQQGFTIEDLTTLLAAKAGLPPQASIRDPAATFDDVGLDSLAYLQMQAELQDRYGFELPDDSPRNVTFGQIVAYVNDHLISSAA